MRLKDVLNQGTNVQMAAEGFRNGEQVAAVAHAARNTGVPFMVLKNTGQPGMKTTIAIEQRNLASTIFPPHSSDGSIIVPKSGPPKVSAGPQIDPWMITENDVPTDTRRLKWRSPFNEMLACCCWPSG